jgi:hypothetical protein
LDLVLEAHGGDATLPLMVEAMRTLPDPYPFGEWREAATRPVAMLDRLARSHPLLAQRALEQWGENLHLRGDLNLSRRAWVTALPEGLAVEGSLWAMDAGLTALPKNLEAGTLSLSGAPIRSLPEGLLLCGSLYLWGCLAWDGWIPDDAAIEGTIHVDDLTLYPDQGVTLAAWRTTHPGRAETQALLAPYLAAGASAAEAVGLLGLAYGQEVALPALKAAVGDLRAGDYWPGAGPAGSQAIPFLDAVAAICPDLARRGLAYWLERNGRVVPELDLSGRAWADALPDGLSVNCWPSGDGLREGGFLMLRWAPIRSLPRNLTVADFVSLDGSALETLPEGLRIGGDLDLRGCASWDGRIPADAQIGGRVETDRHPDGGLRLRDWRAAHPDGERP